MLSYADYDFKISFIIFKLFLKVVTDKPKEGKGISCEDKVTFCSTPSDKSHNDRAFASPLQRNCADINSMIGVILPLGRSEGSSACSIR